MLIDSRDCSACLFSRYGLLIIVGGVGSDFSQTCTLSTVTGKVIERYELEL